MPTGPQSIDNSSRRTTRVTLTEDGTGIEEKPQFSIHTEIQTLANVIERLDNVVGKLQERLSAVMLSPVPRPDDTKLGNPSAQSPIGLTLNEHHRRISAVIEGIVDMLNRLDV